MRTRFLPFVAALAVWLSASPALAVSVERVVSNAGIEAWLVEDHANPIVALRFAFRGGAALDPAGKEGLARLASSTMDEGAGSLDSQAFQGRLDDLSITLRFSADKDSFGGTVKTLTENVDETFHMLGLALTRPRFDAEPVARIRSQILAALRSDLEEPGTVAGRALSARLFPGHVYGRPSDGTLDGVAAVTADDLRQFQRTRLGRDNLVIGVVGDVTPSRLKVLLDEAFSGLLAKAAPWSVKNVAPTLDGGTHVIEKAVPQSSILLAQEGVARDHPDFYVAYVLNHILGGGGFTSRLYDEVREKRGLAYSVGSSLYPLDHASLILVSAGTANARTAETLAVIREQWRMIAKGGISEKEVADAKTFLTGSFPLRFSSSDRIAQILVGMQLDRLGIDYLDTRNGYIDAVTAADVNRVAGTLLAPEKLTAVVAGQPDGLKASKAEH